MNRSTTGIVYLVGAGPGDPGLLTLRADDLLRRCDCVVHDYLVNPAILARIPAGAERIFVGKRGHEDSISQEEINRLLVAAAGRHDLVVRLKGGDPFVFGRGGEECDALAEAGVPFAVVPGITSGVAVPAYAGIPITHRAAASAVAFATGHRKPGADDEAHWAALATMETVVLYMGMQKLGDLAMALIRHGRAAATPVCIVQWGTYAHQTVCEGTLGDIADKARLAGIGAPAITIIGEVVRYRERIRWFDNRPLSGRRVVVTRSRSQVSTLADRLADLGAEVIEMPLLTQAEPLDWSPVDRALVSGTHTWVAFTSANAVRALFSRIATMGHDCRVLAGKRIAAVGAATASALRGHGIIADLVPDSANGRALAASMIAAGIQGSVLLPQADNAAGTLAAGLVDRGAMVEIVVAYRNLPVEPDLTALEGGIDAVTFASSVTAARFGEALGTDGLARLQGKVCRFFAIGPETAAGMAEAGLPVDGIARTADVASLAQAVADSFATAR